MAQKSLLSLVKLIVRMVLLKPTDNTDESEKALVGNTILVAQPSPDAGGGAKKEEKKKAAPPPEEDEDMGFSLFD